jgi:hypothetical protein
MNKPLIQNINCYKVIRISNIWCTVRSTAIGHDILRGADVSNWAACCVERAYVFRNHQNLQDSHKSCFLIHHVKDIFGDEVISFMPVT